jgi:hypothetical protein
LGGAPDATSEAGGYPAQSSGIPIFAQKNEIRQFI